VIDEHIKCDCKGCKERYVGCHATCEKYQDFLKRNEVIRKKRKYDRYVSNNSGWGYRRKQKYE